ncbi:M48 family metallopeptidase [Synoicihabitans lomoniglobus]|uniref:M48 family metallopeptidase n=1 Tax=Synoicihabitans lomoniglobus TaxID=2909285 RepID=A0AAF0CPF0_9BACT|nr:M48 family metallopeptidase [Opitutaceae bacterium LMO-M01]WED64399.1 M48 family metallopeptidase [Opitutaceae bacterium LMO-M01]
MKFVRRDLGESAEASAGGGDRGLRREIVVLVAGIGGLILGAYFGVGFLVEWTLPLISPEREQRWFAEFPVEKSEVVLDAARRDQLFEAQVILDQLTRQPEVPQIPYKLIMVPDRDPNAFAVPGGTIVLTTGLMDVLDGHEIALAFVLGHELGHFAQRDHLRGMGRSIGRGLVWALIFGGSGGVDVVSDRANRLLDLGHSRQQERGADGFGVRLVLAAYGTVEGGERLFSWLAETAQSNAGLTLLSSHPAPEDRIAALRASAAEYAAGAGVK